MNKILFTSILFSFFSLFSQNKVVNQIVALQNANTLFAPYSLLTVDSSISKTEINKALSTSTVAKVTLQKVNEIAATKPDFIALQIPFSNQIYAIQLYKVTIFSEDFSVDSDQGKNIAYQKGAYYRGIINGNPNSIAAFNFFNGEFNGVFSSNDIGNVVVGKIDKPNNQNDYIVYSDSDFKIANGFECHTEDETAVAEVATENKSAASIKCATFYFEIDNNIFVSNGSNTTTTVNWMTSVYNNIQTLFNNDGISTALKSIFVWTTPDIYQGIGTSSNNYLRAFVQNRPVFRGDVGMLVGIDPGGLGGVAYRNSTCQYFNHSYSDLDNISISTVPTYSWTSLVISHEFGHSLGSQHTHACAWNGDNTPIDGCGSLAGYPETGCTLTGPIPTFAEKGTIMSYCHLLSGVGISLANGFGPQPANFMIDTINNKSCLSTDCINNCSNTVANITTTNTTETSATITWQELNSSITTWQIAVSPFTSGTVNWITVTSPSYSVSNLVSNSYYRIRIRPVCAGSTPITRFGIFATRGNICSNMTFFDTGGSTGNYTSGESFVRTFTPTAANQVVQVAFSAFSLETPWDILYIYNGATTSFPEFNAGNGFTGNNSPGTITSTAADGSLTFKFYSDPSVASSGWQAIVSCQQALGTGSNDFIDFSYYPNPTTNKVTLKANTYITEIAVYNIEGRQLFTQKLETLESNVDLSQFASGTYFFKIRFNDLEKNFKIVKL